MMEARGSINEAPGRTMLRDGQAYLFFSGYSYLGMSHVPAFTELLKEGIDRYGALFPSSRISNTPLALYGYLEQYLSQLTGMEDTVTFGSGYLACYAIGQLLSSGGEVLVAPGMHPASGLESETAQGDFRDWALRVCMQATQAAQDHFILAVTSANPLTGEVHDFSFLQDLPREKHFTVLIDDAHGIGWLGEHGEGIASRLMHLPHVEYLIAYSLAKALHVQGGAISCSRAWAEKLRAAPFYAASTPMAPAWAHALLNAGPLYEVQRALLAHNMDFLQRLLEVALDEGAPAGSLLEPTAMPVFLCKAPDLGRFLEQKGILVSSFAYPDPTGPRIERIVVSALHEEGDLESLVRACNIFPHTATNG